MSTPNYLNSLYDQQGNLIQKPQLPSPIVNVPQQVSPQMPAPINNLQAGPYEQKQGQLAMSYPDMNSPEYHIGKLHGILNMIGGAIGGIGGHPEVGKELALGRINRARDNADRQIKALDEPVRSEISRRAANVQTDKENRLTQNEKDLNGYREQLTSAKKEALDATTKWHQGELDTQKYKTDLADANKKAELAEKKLKDSQDELDKIREDTTKKSEGQANRENRTTNATILSNKQDRTPAPIQAAADNILSSFKDPKLSDQVVRDTIDAQTDSKVKDALIAGLPSIGRKYIPGTKVTGQQANQATQAVSSMVLINKARDIVNKIPDQLGPIKGRINEGKLYIGTDDKNVIDLQHLKTILTLLPASETAALAGGRATGVLYKLLKGAGGSFNMPKSELLAALDGVYDFAKQRARGQGDNLEDDKPKGPKKVTILSQ